MSSSDFRTFARSIIETLERLGATYLIGGSVASSQYSAPRATVDIDIAIAIPFEDTGRLIRAFQDLGYYASLDAVVDAVVHEQPFNVIDGVSGYKADLFLILEPTALERSALARRRREVYDDQTGAAAWFYAPEDVIIYKLRYYLQGRMDKHLRDIAAMLMVQGDDLDWAYLDRWAREVGAGEVWDLLVKEYRRRVRAQEQRSGGAGEQR
jgi:uncharacterized protein (DUF1330 family)